MVIEDSYWRADLIKKTDAEKCVRKWMPNKQLEPEHGKN
jgi:hypothetical protein